MSSTTPMSPDHTRITAQPSQASRTVDTLVDVEFDAATGHVVAVFANTRDNRGRRAGTARKNGSTDATSRVAFSLEHARAFAAAVPTAKAAKAAMAAAAS